MFFPKFVYMTKNTPFFPILHVFAPLNDVRAYSAWSCKITLIMWIFGRAWYPPWHSSGPPGAFYWILILIFFSIFFFSFFFFSEKYYGFGLILWSFTSQQDYYGRQRGTLLHSYCTGTYTEVIVLLLWGNSAVTMEYPQDSHTATLLE